MKAGFSLLRARKVNGSAKQVDEITRRHNTITKDILMTLFTDVDDDEVDLDIFVVRFTTRTLVNMSCLIKRRR